MPDKPIQPGLSLVDLREAIIAGAMADSLARPRPPSPQEQHAEKQRCTDDPLYFINRYCNIYDNATEDWIPFNLWPAQAEMIQAIHLNKQVVILKTRQIGATWICLCYALYRSIFHPIASILIWSRTDEDATELLGEKRLKGVFERLPAWLKPDVKENNEHDFGFKNGSIMHALPTTRGDGFTATYAFIDEADLDPNLAIRLERSKPTINAGNCKLVLNSRADKANPNSTFKQIYKAAVKGDNSYKPVFIPWHMHPERTAQWYEQECRDSMSTHGSLDEIAANYPTTDVEALAARSLDKRYSPQWISWLTKALDPLPLPFDAPNLPGLKIYAEPEAGHHYGIGLDPAGGAADSDDSALCVVDADSAEQVASLAGKIEPTQFANYAADVSAYYFNAPILFELNNHGHATLAQLRERGVSLRNGIQRDGTSSKPGWLTSERTKHMLYDVGAKVIQAVLEEAKLNDVVVQGAVRPIIFDFTTSVQLASVDIGTLKAPEGQHDDYAMAWVLAQMCVYRGTPSMMQQKHVGLWGKSRSRDVIQTVPTQATLDGRRVEAPIQPPLPATTPVPEQSREQWLNNLRQESRRGGFRPR